MNTYIITTTMNDYVVEAETARSALESAHFDFSEAETLSGFYRALDSYIQPLVVPFEFRTELTRRTSHYDSVVNHVAIAS